MILLKEKKYKKFYITTSIAYVNSAPHIGFTLELLQADVLARYHRLLNDKVFFLTGADEHGRKIVQAAKNNNLPVEKFVKKITAQFEKLTQELNISNNFFIRTTDKKNHWPNVKKIWQKLEKAGDLYKKKYRGLYCVGHESFVTKKELKNNLCVLHQKKPELIEEENYFFRLSKYSVKIKNLIQKNKIKILPLSRRREILNFIKNPGLQDISFSRPRQNLSWGIPVPNDKTQTIYVWADALTNYLYPKKFWPADVHIIGKDILRFHAAIWPAMLLAAKLPLPKTIFAHGFITVNGQKMSKTLGNVVNPFELIKKYGVDAVRYYLLREIPAADDGDFSYEKLEKLYNADLVKGLGNLEARIRGITSRSARGNPKSSAFAKASADKQFLNKLNKAWKDYHKALNNFEFSEALKIIWDLISFSDKYIDQTQPWKIKNGKELKKNIGNLNFILLNIAWLLKPFLPETAEKILNSNKVNKKAENLFPSIKT